VADITKKGVKFPQKYPWQRWVNFAYETPAYFPLQAEPLWNRNMDWNMSYVQKGSTSVPVTLMCMWGGGELEDLLKPPPPRTETAPVIFMGNCYYLFQV
jgi:hypothetical protein